MALPRNLQAQLEAAEALLAQANPPAPSAGDAPPLTDPANLPPSDPPEPNAVPPQPQESPTPQVAVPTPPLASDEETWQERYKSLKGLFNKEVPSLQQQVRQLTEQGQRTAQQLETLSAVKHAPAAAVKSEVDPRDVESFGSDLVDMVRRVSQQAQGDTAQIDSTVEAFKQRIEQLERETQEAAQAVVRAAEKAFFDRLAKQVPEWESVNESDEFLSWLASIDPVYGISRQSGLNEARKSLNADWAVSVFRAFESTRSPAPTAAANPLSKQVSPRAVASPTPTQQADQGIISQKYITDFYGDQTRGKYRGRDDEAQRIEQVINQAMAEDRIGK
jgi:hypothetical protein